MARLSSYFYSCLWITIQITWPTWKRAHWQKAQLPKANSRRLSAALTHALLLKDTQFSDNMAVHGLTQESAFRVVKSRLSQSGVLLRGYLIHGWMTWELISNKQTSQHNEDTQCASWLLGCHNSAFSPGGPVCACVSTGIYWSLRWLREYYHFAKPHYWWRPHETCSW